MATNKKLRILYVGNFATLSVGEPEIANCLEELGHTVVRIQERETNPDQLNMLIRNEKFDFLLFAKLRIAEYGPRGDFLKNLSIPSVCWLFDLFFGL